MTSPLSVKGFGLASGIIWALAILLLPIFDTQLGWGSGLAEVLYNSYPGYSATVQGAIIGAVEGFIDAGLGGAIFAWLYNKLA